MVHATSSFSLGRHAAPHYHFLFLTYVLSAYVHVQKIEPTHVNAKRYFEATKAKVRETLGPLADVMLRKHEQQHHEHQDDKRASETPGATPHMLAHSPPSLPAFYMPVIPAWPCSLRRMPLACPPHTASLVSQV